MKLDPHTTRKTDEQFYKNHPEMVRNGKRIPIDPSNPAHKGMAADWQASYRQNNATKPQPQTASPSPSASPAQVVAACPASPTSNQPPVPPCCFKGVTVKCGHGSRGYTMSLPLGPDKVAKGETELHVIAGHTRPDKVDVIMSGGPCNYGYPETPRIGSATREGSALKSTSTITVEAFAPERKLTRPSQWKSMLWPNVTTDCLSYPVSTTACEGAAGCTTTIKAFPYVKWSVSAGFSLPGAKTTQKQSGKNTDDHDTRKFVEWSRQQNGWKFKVPTVSLELDKGSGGGSTKHELGMEFSSHVKDALTVFQNFKDFSDVAGGLLSSMGGPSWEVKYPAVDLSYTCETVEIAGTPPIGVQGEAKFALAPLIGLTFSYDILNWLLGMANLYAPGLGTILVKIKKRAEKGFFKESVKVELSLKFTIDGSIEGNLAWTKKEAAAKNWDSSGEITGKIDGSFVGKAAATADVWIVSMGGGAETGGKTGVAATLKASQEAEGLCGNGTLSFAGVTLFYTTYVTAGRVSKPPKKRRRYADDSREVIHEEHSSSSPSSKSESGEEYKLVDPAEWPEGGKKFTIIANS